MRLPKFAEYDIISKFVFNIETVNSVVTYKKLSRKSDTFGQLIDPYKIYFIFYLFEFDISMCKNG